MNAYVYDYATDKINTILHIELHDKKSMESRKKAIAIILELYSDRLITTDEAMLMIAKA